MATFVRVTDVVAAWGLYDSGLLWWRSAPFNGRAGAVDGHIYERAANIWKDTPDAFEARIIGSAYDSDAFGVMVEE